jgi:hypothetical protein
MEEKKTFDQAVMEMIVLLKKKTTKKHGKNFWNITKPI